MWGGKVITISFPNGRSDPKNVMLVIEAGPERPWVTT